MLAEQQPTVLSLVGRINLVILDLKNVECLNQYCLMSSLVETGVVKDEHENVKVNRNEQTQEKSSL